MNPVDILRAAKHVIGHCNSKVLMVHPQALIIEYRRLSNQRISTHLVVAHVGCVESFQKLIMHKRLWKTSVLFDPVVASKNILERLLYLAQYKMVRIN